MADLTAVLQAASSHEMHVRAPAEEHLKQLEQNLPVYLVGLCQELGSKEKPPQTRQLAGLLLKNTMVARDEQQKQILAQRWSTLPDETRGNVKGMVLLILADPAKPIRSTASMVVAAIAAIEIPNGLWLDLVPGLVHKITKEADPYCRQACFEALGYVCEECPEQLQESSNIILNAISTGMKKEEESSDIKLAATKALCNSLEFVRGNFENEVERNLIMQMVFNSTQCEEVDVRVAAYQCLVEIGSTYYEFLGQYIQDLFNLTSGAIKNEDEEVSQQAIEFWSTICDCELGLQEEMQDANDKGVEPKHVTHNFALQALNNNLMPLILECLTKQSEEVDDDTWNVAMASGVCLGLFAQTVTDEVVQHVLPFVQNNIQNPDWRFREAATLAFGCILDGPTKEKLAPLVQQAFALILGHMSDESALVKDTTAWTIGRICNLLPECIDGEALPALMNALLQGLTDVPKVAANVCWAIHNLSEAVEVPAGKDSSAISPYFEGMMRGLFTATVRPDVNEANLLTSSYEAINILIHTAAPDMYELVGQLIPELIARLKNTLLMQGLTGEEKEKQNEVQALLCGALQETIQKLDENIIVPHADTLMLLFLQVLQSKNATVHEEALMAIGAIANRVNDQFEKYMNAFQQFLVLGLRNAEEHHVCIVAVGVVGDLARALEAKLVPYCDEIMQLLLQNLQNPQMEVSVKPHIICCLGDIALAVGGHFDRYLPYVMMMLAQASQTQFENPDYDDMEYLSTLREGILESYTGILQGLSADGQAPLFLQFVDNVLGFLDLIAKDGDDVEDPVIRAAVGVIGDLASQLSPQIASALQRPSIQALIQYGLHSENGATKEAANWAHSVVMKVLQ